MESKLEAVIENIHQIVEECALLMKDVSEVDFMRNREYVALSIREKVKQVVTILLYLKISHPELYKRFPKWANYLMAADQVAEHNIGSEVKITHIKLKKFIYKMVWKLAIKSLPQLILDLENVLGVYNPYGFSLEFFLIVCLFFD